MDIGSAFTYMFDDEGWIAKIAIGGGLIFAGLLLSPIIIGLALFLPISGYMLEALKNVRDGRPIPLPEWSNFGELFRKGLMVFLIGLVYNIPSLILGCLSFGVNIGMQQEVDPDVQATLGIAVACLSCLQFVVSLITNAVLPAAIIRYAEYDTFGSAFQFSEVFKIITSNLGDYIIIILLSWVAGFLALLGIILCGIGVLFTGFWSVLVTANLYGQLARKVRLAAI
jgi:hypothetical protein